MTMNGGTGSPARPDGVGPSIRRVLDHIDANFANPLPLSGLAELAELSLHRLITVFRSQVGIPPHQYVCRIRVQHARRLLGQGLPAASVALDSGFCDQSHLTRQFKRHCGVTPGHFAHASRTRLPELSPCA